MAKKRDKEETALIKKIANDLSKEIIGNEFLTDRAIERKVKAAIEKAFDDGKNAGYNAGKEQYYYDAI